MNDFRDDDEVKKVLYPEVQLLIKKLTSAKRVITFDHKYRTSESTTSHTHGVKGSAASTSQVVHGDFTKESAERRLKVLS